MILRWIFSTTVRNAVAMRKQVHRFLCAQRDVLSPAALQLVSGALLDFQKALDARVDKATLKKEMARLEAVANKWLKPYPHATLRENVEVLLVALAVAMAIRTFFLQPFKIPTGSMQPTLYGVTSENLVGDKDFQMPTGLERVKEWFEGISYVHVVAPTDGFIRQISPMRKFLIFNIKQSIWIGGSNDYSPGTEQTMWFPPDYGETQKDMFGNPIDPLIIRAGLRADHFYHKGDDVIKLKVATGDHLFVDRLTYNFRKPERGEIIVFETAGIPKAVRETNYPPIPGNEFYIKRLVVLPNERVSIGDDRHLVINGLRLDASTPHFAHVYGFNPDDPPRESEYSGHVNGTVAREFHLYPNLSPVFPNAQTVFTNGPNTYMAMGDNTCNSSDSRTWGTLATSSVIGKAFFVYWPITRRFGIANE
ncbi:MAG TPA: signal peptidase I [Candidatus Paceibacterota bacterium]|nr:signal peptidase I [Candidatus Paceibacterota bacterium]